MTDQLAFGQDVADALERMAAERSPAGAVDDIVSRASRMRPLPRWLALIKEPPMRTSSSLVVGSPVARVAALLVAASLLATAVVGTGVVATRLLAADDAIVVDPSGNGDATTIGEAVAMAEDGDTILIRPGRYVEAIAIVGKDLSISGEGDRDDIVVEAAVTTPAVSFVPASTDVTVSTEDEHAFALLLSDTRTTISNLTVVGQPVGTAIPVVGAGTAAILDGIVVRVMGQPTGHWMSINWTEGSSGSLVGESVVEGWLAIGPETDVTIEGNDLPATCVVAWESGATIVIRDNTIHGCPYEKGIDVDSANTVLIEGNEIWVEDLPLDANSDGYSGGRPAIEVVGDGPGSVTIRDNRLHDSLFGIVVNGGDPPMEVSQNRIYANGVGVSGIDEAASLVGNTIEGNVTGVEIGPLAVPTLEDNTISGNRAGLAIGGGAEPVLVGNTLCDNDTNVASSAGAEIDLSGNEVCADGPTGEAS